MFSIFELECSRNEICEISDNSEKPVNILIVIRPFLFALTLRTHYRNMASHYPDQEYSDYL